ncbi:MAG: DUF3391 domain-containing protein [Sphingomonadales bacterium]|nr:MAG: DUF3391 domain-containing protein [Sphingomonadales bacterium]
MPVTVASADLRAGMYVASVDGAWINNPFWRSSFKLSAQDQERIHVSALGRGLRTDDKGKQRSFGVTNRAAPAKGCAHEPDHA